jgi:hypothetical protein
MARKSLKEKLMSTRVIAVAFMSAVCGCAALVHETRAPAVERLDGHGVSSAMLDVEAGSELRFVNADARPHQIYSNDCGEVSSTLLKPGDVYSTQLGAGPKLCHFEDLLAPLDAGYSGTLQVHAPPVEPDLGLMDG